MTAILLVIACVVGGVVLLTGLLLVAAMLFVAGMADRDAERWQERREEMDLLAVRESRLARNQGQRNRG